MFYLCRGAYAAFDRCEALSFEIAHPATGLSDGQQSHKPIRRLRKTPYFDPVRITITLRAYAMKRKALRRYPKIQSILSCVLNVSAILALDNHAKPALIERRKWLCMPRRCRDLEPPYQWYDLISSLSQAVRALLVMCRTFGVLTHGSHRHLLPR
jgi:hypothetical protein